MTQRHETRILYIEDNPQNVLLLDRFLRAQAEFTFASAATAGEGFERISAERPDIVLLDMNLPDASGMQVIEGIRERCGDDMPAVVAVTGDVTLDEAALMDAGFSAIVAKPVRLVELRDQLMALAGRPAPMA